MKQSAEQLVVNDLPIAREDVETLLGGGLFTEDELAFALAQDLSAGLCKIYGFDSVLRVSIEPDASTFTISRRGGSLQEMESVTDKLIKCTVAFLRKMDGTGKI